MALINSSYFIGEKSIPNTSYPEVAGIVSNLIAIHEKDFLIKLLGYELFKLFIAGIAVGSPDQRYLDIKNGVEFTGLDGRLKKWEGLVDATTFKSPIADYVYYHYLRQVANNASGVGQVQATVENSMIVSSAKQQARSYNNMVTKCMLFVEFMQLNGSVYPEYQFQLGNIDLWNLLTRVNAYNF